MTLLALFSLLALFGASDNLLASIPSSIDKYFLQDNIYS